MNFDTTITPTEFTPRFKIGDKAFILQNGRVYEGVVYAMKIELFYVPTLNKCVVSLGHMSSDGRGTIQYHKIAELNEELFYKTKEDLLASL